MSILPIEEVIPEKNIVILSPHFDDFFFMMGGYILELKERNLLATKNFHINVIFSRSNYLARTGAGNFDTTLDRLKLATGKRLLEDMGCIDELLGEFNYRYELWGEKECFVREKLFADSEMEFPHGMYEDFDSKDEQIFFRIKERVKRWANYKDTALVFPAAIKEHIDHFITREAGLKTAKTFGRKAGAAFYFLEDKPYAGIATPKELCRLESFIADNQLDVRVYKHHPEKLIELAFKHYISQVEEVYKIGIMERSNCLKKLYKADFACDRLFVFNKG
jgi:hypothetical protein